MNMLTFNDYTIWLPDETNHMLRTRLDQRLFSFCVCIFFSLSFIFSCWRRNVGWLLLLLLWGYKMSQHTSNFNPLSAAVRFFELLFNHPISLHPLCTGRKLVLKKSQKLTGVAVRFTSIWICVGHFWRVSIWPNMYTPGTKEVGVWVLQLLN